jgi:uncharacterized protein
MRFDLRQLGRKGSGTLRDEHVDRTFQASELEAGAAADEAYKVAGPAHLVMDVHKDGDAYRASGRVSTRVGLECGRCLEAFEVPIDSPFELRYIPAPAAGGDGDEAAEREVSEDDLTTAFYQDEAIDLGELMHEQFVLALPMKPLCTETCRGLCPHCGTNLNKGTCDCNPSWTDPRLEALKGLMSTVKTDKEN